MCHLRLSGAQAAAAPKPTPKAKATPKPTVCRTVGQVLKGRNTLSTFTAATEVWHCSPYYHVDVT